MATTAAMRDVAATKQEPDVQAEMSTMARAGLVWDHPFLTKTRLAPHTLSSQQLACSIVRHARACFAASTIQTPDAWLNPHTVELFFSAQPPPAIPLVPGDILQISACGKLPFLTFLSHDALYVGKGFIIDVCKLKWFPRSRGEVGEVAPRNMERKLVAWRSPACNANVPARMRLERIYRAACSTGYYRYNTVRSNCQHIVSTWLQDSHNAASSVALSRVAILAAGAAAATAVAAVTHHAIQELRTDGEATHK